MAALSVAAGGTEALSGGHCGLWERVEGEDLRTRASLGSLAGEGYQGRARRTVMMGRELRE